MSGASEASKDRIELLDADPDRCIEYLFQLVCSDFAPKQNEPATLKQCIAVQAAQNVNHVDIIVAEWKRIATLGILNSGVLRFLGTRSLAVRPRRAGHTSRPFSVLGGLQFPQRGTHSLRNGGTPVAQKTFLLIASIIFSLIALGHLSRLVFKWSASLGGWAIPFWVNWVALLVFVYLASEGFRLARKP